MYQYQFLAKQGQHEQVARILRQFAKPHLKIYKGLRGRGVMVSANLIGISNRLMDRLLYANGIPGAVSRRNRFKIYRASGGYVDHWKIRESIGYNVPFILVRNRKMRKAVLKHIHHGCDCCSYEEVVEI